MPSREWGRRAEYSREEVNLAGDGFDDDCGLEFPLIFTATCRALQERARFEVFLDQIGATAIRTLLGDGPCPRDKIAVGISIAPVECFPPLRTTFHYFAFRTFRAFHTDRLLFHIFTGRIITAGGKLAKTPVFLNQIIAALGAFLVERNIGFLLRTPDLFGGFAVRIAGTCEESAETALL